MSDFVIGAPLKGIDTDRADSMTAAEAAAFPNVFAANLKGMVPSPGTPLGTRFLRDDGTWVVVSGGTNASDLVSGTLADARLSPNVPLLDGTNVFSVSNEFTGVGLISSIVSGRVGLQLDTMYPSYYVSVGANVSRGVVIGRMGGNPTQLSSGAVITGDVLPNVASAYKLGNSAYPWQEIYGSVFKGNLLGQVRGPQFSALSLTDYDGVTSFNLDSGQAKVRGKFMDINGTAPRLAIGSSNSIDLGNSEMTFSLNEGTNVLTVTAKRTDGVTKTADIPLA